MVYEPNASPLGFFTSTTAPGMSKELRQRIALAMLVQKKKYPTNLGEGLSAIGDSLGEIGTMRRLAAEEGADFASGNKRADDLLGTSPPGAPPSPPPAAAATVAPTSLAGGADPMSQAPVPPTAPESGPPKGMTMRPGINMPPPMQAAAPAVPTPPDQQQSYEPGAPVRMSTPAQIADFRGQNPLPPNIPPPPGQQPQPPGWTTDKQFNAIDAAAATPPAPPRPSVADYGQKLALAPTPPPDAPVPAAAPPGGDDPRRAIALAMLKQGQTGQPQSSAFAPAAPPAPVPPAAPPDQGIAAAPPAAPPIRAMPPPQVAQAAPPAGPQPGYISPPLPDVKPPAPGRMSDMEAKIRDAIARDPNGVNGQLAMRLAPVLKTLEDNRKAEDARQIEQYKIDLAAHKTRQENIESQKAGAAQNIVDVARKQSEATVDATKARIVERSGLTPDELYKRLDTERQSTDQAIKAQNAQQLARKAIKDGVITGYGADMKVAGAKFADWAFKNGLKGDLAANTEIMKAGLNAGLSEAIKTVNGEGGVGVSNTDVRIAQGIQGSDPNLQMKTIQTIMDRAAEINHRKINRYEDYVDKTLSGEPSEARYLSTHGPTAPPDKIKLLVDAQADPAKADEYRRFFDQTYGPGAAELELARVERAQRRRGR